MVDIPGNNTTTQSIAVGGALDGTLEVAGDHDWVRIELTAGQSIRVFLDGLTLEDPYLRIRDASGTVLYENDDITSGTNRDSLLAFTANYSGTYFIDVGAWEDNYTGTYKLSVDVYTPPPVASIDLFADQLVSGFWNGEQHRFNVTQGGSLTVNFTALTADGTNLARAALATWTDIIGVRFVEVASGGQIRFDDDEDGAHASSIYSGGFISSSDVNVSTEWLADYGTTLSGYAFQTYVHEIGHALGLGHAGNYNGEARYPFDARFANDSWALSVMSYFDQQENTHFAGMGFARNFAVTPMIADIVAMSRLYGLSTTTRTDNSVYGSSWHTNMGALTIFDSAGNDTIDTSGLGGDQRIDLNPGTFSNILGEVGNVAIARGVIIENARSGSGNDTLIGNEVANVLDGGAGNDTLAGGGGNDWLNPGYGNNSIDGGAGSDTLDYASGFTAAVNVNLATGIARNQGGAGTDSFTSIENVRGTTENDTLIGDAAANVLEGHLGNDTIDGGDGNDTLRGDTAETLTFGGADTLNGGAGADTLIGGAGNDLLNGGAGNDVLNGESGLDRALYSGLFRSFDVRAYAAAGTVSGNAVNGADTLSGIEFMQFQDGVFDFNHDGLAAQVTRLYDTVLQRGPDQVGLDFYVDLLEDRGGTLKQVANAFLNSPEFQALTGSLSNADYVEFLYRHALDRNSDPAGKSFYVSRLDSGVSDRADLLVNFSESPEHRAATAALVNEGFFNTDDMYQAVALLYDTFAGRMPDAGGLTYYAERLKSGELTLDQVADHFAASPEFRGLTSGMTNMQLVQFMYQNTLDRPGEAAGVQYWTQRLDAGMDRGDLLLGFSQSNEHFSLLGEHVTNGIDFF